VKRNSSDSSGNVKEPRNNFKKGKRGPPFSRKKYRKGVVKAGRYSNELLL